MIHFEGEQRFPHPVATVAAKLSHAGFVAHCVPDATVTLETPDKACGKIRPKLAFLTGSMTIEARVTACEPGKSVVYQVVSTVIGASSTVVTKLEFAEAEGGGTVVRWTGDVTAMTGLLRAVPKGLLEGAAKKVVEDVWASVQAKMNGSRGG